MKNILTKKNVLWGSSLYVFFLSVLYVSGFDCYQNSWCHGTLGDLISRIIFALLPLIGIFFFSLLTYRMKDEVFLYWITFTKWYMPAWIFSSFFLLNSRSYGGGFGSFIDNWLRGVLVLGLLCAYLLVSIILIIKKRLEK